MANTVIMPDRNRMHGIDVLRAGAIVLVVLLHSAHGYIPNQMPGLIWPVHDARPSLLVDGLFWWIEGMIMPLFLWMSGWFSWDLLASLGPDGFLRHRVKRILAPLAFASLCILPANFYAWAFGLVLDGRSSWRKLRSLQFDPDIQNEIWGLSHLWYLEYVFLYCLIAYAAVHIGRRYATPVAWAVRSVGRRVAAAPAILLTMMFVPATGILVVEPEVVIGFQHGFLPYPAKFLYSGLFFFGGLWMKAGGRQTIDVLRGRAIASLIVTVPLYLIMLTLTHRWFTSSGFAPIDGLVYAAVTSLFAWFTVFGFVGLCLRIDRPPHAAVRYVAEASFWIYLAHHPLVGLISSLLGPTTPAAGIKFVVVATVTLAVTLWTYHTFVRSTWIGELLNGRRYQPIGRQSDRSDAHADDAHKEQRRAA